MSPNKILLANLDMENAALHDVEVLQGFIASRYQSIRRIEVHRLTQPEHNFTGTTASPRKQ